MKTQKAKEGGRMSDGGKGDKGLHTRTQVPRKIFASLWDQIFPDDADELEEEEGEEEVKDESPDRV